MTEYSRSARETLRLPGDIEGPPAAAWRPAAPWAVFDPIWYRSRYPDAPAATPAEILEWHLTQGQRIGHSPNPYFEEEWQREAWPGILPLIEAGSVASAFDAWCRGPHATRAPHWLFEPREYRTRYPALTEEALAETGFINRYDHYLRFGAAERRIGHALFDPTLYLSALDPAEAEAAAAMPFRHYLRGLETGAPERLTSVWFDIAWYRDRYPEAVELVRAGNNRSLLEHYLRNGRPTEFNPSPWFSEEWYLANNPGLARMVGPEGFRNGFAHFRAHGLAEGRSPHPDLDLDWYGKRDDVRADIGTGRAPDPFTHWVALGQPTGLPGRPPPEIVITEAVATALLRRRTDAILPLFGRGKLDFSYQGIPAISAIVTVADDPAETLVSLISLRSHYGGTIELILIGADADGSIEAHITGATWLRFDTPLTDTAAREAGLMCAVADAILLLGKNIELAPRAIENALARLAGDPAIGVVGGRLIQPHGVLSAAGGIVWGDGTLHDYMRNASPLAAEANFVRDTDFCSTLFLLARRGVLTALPGQAAGLAGTTHDAADLCTRIWRAGFRVVYEPDAVGFFIGPVVERRPDGRSAYVAAHAEFLATRPGQQAAVIHTRSPDRGAPRILFIEDAIPLRRIGSGFVRSNDVLRAMEATGARITVFPMRRGTFPLSVCRAELPDTVEVMQEAAAAGFAAFMASRQDYYDIIWIARTHNLDRVRETFASEPPRHIPAFGDVMSEFGGPTHVVTRVDDSTPPVWRPLWRKSDGADEASPRHVVSHPRVIVDTEAVTSVRQAERAASLGQPFDLDTALREEFRHLTPAMGVVAVSEAEAALLRAHHRGEVAVLGHAIAPSPTGRAFDERAGLLFVGAIHDLEHPNHDGIAWFIDEVLPLIEDALHWETRLTVAGYVAPGVSLDRFKGHPRVTLRGAVADLAPLYDAHRVCVAPARFAAGIPYKVHEAAAFGLPVVATSLLARQLGWRADGSISAAEATDPAGFAARVVALYRDAALWTRIREAALAQVANELDPGEFAARLAALLRFR